MRIVPALALFEQEVSAQQGRQDRIQLSIEGGELHADIIEAGQFRNVLAIPPQSARDSPTTSAFGDLFSRPQGRAPRFKHQGIRNRAFYCGGNSRPVPLFGGRLEMYQSDETNKWNLRHRIVHNSGFTAYAALIDEIEKRNDLKVAPVLVYNEIIIPVDLREHATRVCFTPDPQQTKQIFPEEQRRKIIVKNAYIDFAYGLVKGFFDHVFAKKGISDGLILKPLSSDVKVAVDNDQDGTQTISFVFDD